MQFCAFLTYRFCIIFFMGISIHNQYPTSSVDIEGDSSGEIVVGPSPDAEVAIMNMRHLLDDLKRRLDEQVSSSAKALMMKIAVRAAEVTPLQPDEDTPLIGPVVLLQGQIHELEDEIIILESDPDSEEAKIIIRKQMDRLSVSSSSGGVWVPAA